MDGTKLAFLGSHEQIGRIYLIFLELSETDTRNRVYLLNGINLIVPKHHPKQVVAISQINIYRISLHPEVTAIQVQIIANIQAIHQSTEKDIPIQQLTPFDFNHIVIEVGRIPHTINARHGRNNHHILASGEQGRGSCQTKLVNLIIDGQVLFYIGIRRWEIGLRLIIVIVRDIILHGIVREKTLELPVKLGSQRLVVTQDECRLVDVLDDIGNGKGLARTGHPQQCLCRYSLDNTFSQLGDSFRLVARRLIIRNQFKIHKRNKDLAM